MQTKKVIPIEMHLSIIIVSYNTRDDLRACLESLQVVQPAPEIIVVDNASSDGSADMVRAEFPHVRLLAQARNTWFCGGNNIGIQAATGDYILLLNPDTIVQPGALERLTAFLDSHPDYTGATAQLRYPDGSIQRTCSHIPTYAYLLLEHTPLGWLLPRWHSSRARRPARAISCRTRPVSANSRRGSQPWQAPIRRCSAGLFASMSPISRRRARFSPPARASRSARAMSRRWIPSW